MSESKRGTRDTGDAEPGIAISGVRLVKLPVNRDGRGALSFAQVEDQLPFTPLRYFLLFDLVPEQSRGAHAHRELEQFLVCVHGACTVMLDDGQSRTEVQLNDPAVGVYVPRLIWTTVVPASEASVVLVLASARYDAADYIRDYREFKAQASDSELSQ
jgi:UDP-2-acetamido-3-amino-2,3-dideoxy-glucuronate N-acetyltransferase